MEYEDVFSKRDNNVCFCLYIKKMFIAQSIVSEFFDIKHARFFPRFKDDFTKSASHLERWYNVVQCGTRTAVHFGLVLSMRARVNGGSHVIYSI